MGRKRVWRGWYPGPKTVAMAIWEIRFLPGENGTEDLMLWVAEMGQEYGNRDGQAINVAEARELARALLEAANTAEGK